MKEELIKQWKEYMKFLREHGEEEYRPFGGGFYSFYWFMEWLETGTLPGKRFQEKSPNVF